MAKGTPLTSFVFFAVAVTCARGAVRFSDCPDGNVSRVDQVESVSLSCLLSEDPQSLVRWTLLNDSGVSLDLASCDVMAGACVTNHSGIATVAINSGQVSTTITSTTSPGVTTELSGVVSCAETRAGQEVATASCRLRVVNVRISTGSVGTQDVQEGTTHSLTCLISPGISTQITWTLTTTAGTVTPVTVCDVGTTCSKLLGDITVVRAGGVSLITISNVNSTVGGVMSCSITDNGGQQKLDSVVLNVFKTPTVESCSIVTLQQNWSAVVTCNVTQIRSSADIYDLEVKELYLSDLRINNQNNVVNNFWLQFSEQSQPETQTVTYRYHGKSSFRLAMTSFTDPADGRLSYRGLASFSWRLAPEPAQDWLVRVYVCAGVSSPACYQYQQVMPSIDVPSTPTHNCTTVPDLSENVATVCLCAVQSTGFPEGRLAWMAGNVTLTAGVHGVKQLLLTPASLTGLQDGSEVKCQLDWIEPKLATPSLTYRFVTVTTVPMPVPVTAKGEDEDYTEVKWAGIGAAILLGLEIIVVGVVLLAYCVICPRMFAATRVKPL